MARELDEDVLEQVLSPVKNVAVLMEADFDSQPLRLFGGYGTLTIDGTDYLGSGRLISVEPAQETAEVQATNATVQLSGVQEADIAIALQENYQGRRCRLKLAFLDASMKVIGAPVQIFSGRMDVMNLNDDPQNPLITMTAESAFIRMSVARNRSRTHEDQQIDYDGDRGLEFVTAMQNKTIYT